MATKVSEQDVQTMQELRDAGHSLMAIGKRFGITKQRVGQITTGKPREIKPPPPRRPNLRPPPHGADENGKYRIPVLDTVTINDNHLLMDIEEMRTLRARINNALSGKGVRMPNRCWCGRYSKHLAKRLGHKCGSK